MENIKYDKKEVERIQKGLECDFEEALKIWLDDNKVLTEEEKQKEKELNKKVKNYTSSENKHAKKQKVRKVDNEKLNLLNIINETIKSQIDENSQIEKEIAINFAFGDENYTLKLVKHRKAKERNRI